MNNKCLGCGSILQSIDSNKQGYIPEKVIDKQLCQRCFRLKHYHEIPQNNLARINNKKTKGLHIFLADLVNFNEEIFNFYKKLNEPKIFVISKCDLIPKDINYQKIENWLKKYLKIEEQIIFLSIKNTYNLNTLLNIINSTSLKNIYFYGCTNAGKSSLINYLFNKNITISNIPNTTLEEITFKYQDKIIHDTVGIVSNMPLNSYLYTNDKSKLKQITMPLKENASILIEPLIRIETVNKNKIVCYYPKNLKPVKVYLNQSKYLDQEKITLNVEAKSNIFIKGIGFFYIVDKGIINIYNIKRENLYIVPSFLRSDYV